MCTQFIRVYDLSTDAAAPLHTFYLPATVEDASGDGVGSCIRDVVLIPANPITPSPQSSSELGSPPRDSTEPPRPPLATAIVLTGAGRLYGKGIPAPGSSSEPLDVNGGCAAHDGEIRHRLIIPPLLEEEAREADGGPGRGGDDDGGGGNGGRGGRSDSVGGASADTSGGGGAGGGAGNSAHDDEEEVESPVSGMDSPSSPSYLYLSAFAGCDFDDVVSDSPDESLIFAEPGLRRRGWAGSSATAAAASSSSAAAAVSAADAVLAMSPVRLARASAEAQETAAASFGGLHFSAPTGLVVVARGGKSTLALRLRGAGDGTAVRGGFVLLPRLTSTGVGSGSGGGGGESGATPVAQGTSVSSARSDGSSTALAAATLEANSCLPPYTRFLDYWDGAGELAGGGDENSGSVGNVAAAAAAASLVCVATGGGRVKADRVLAMRASGGGGGEGQTVSRGVCVAGCVGDALRVVEST